MSNVSLVVYNIQVVGIPVYVCADCNVLGQGSTVRLNIGCMREYDAAVANINPTHMPMGWACYGRDVVRCVKCVQQRQ